LKLHIQYKLNEFGKGKFLEMLTPSFEDLEVSDLVSITSIDI